MKMLLALLLLSFAVSCAENKNSGAQPAESMIVDSFEVNSIQSLSEFLSFQKINDSVFRSMDLQDHYLNYYVKHTGKIFTFKAQNKTSLKGYCKCFFCNQNGDCFSVNDDGVVYRFNKDFSVSDSIRFTYPIPYLKNNYCFYSYNSSPLVILGDTFIGAIGYKELEGYYTWFKEPSIMEFVLKGDSMTNIHYYFSKPAGLEKIRYPWPSYCYHDNTIALIYPGFDTLYTYNRITRKESKTALNNPDYKKPAEYNTANMQDFSYDTKYELANFGYEAIYFNELTGHYILIYKLPAENKDKSRATTFDDQHRGALILDKHFAKVSNTKFQRRYFDPANYFFYPGKGLAMPVFKGKNSYDTTKFYIYNF